MSFITNALFVAQVWDGQNLVTQVDDVSQNAAREIAKAGPLAGFTGRIMANSWDYCECFWKDGTVTRGKFGDVTRVEKRIA